MQVSLDAEYWNQRYIRQETGWDLHQVSPPLQAYIDQLTDKNLSILIPGAGNAHEAIYLAEQGFRNITVLDIAESAIRKLRERCGHTMPAIKILEGDFFHFSGTYDLILEQTFFCALPPVRRPDYVQQMASLLSGNGKLVGLLFNRDFEQSPPFGGHEEMYRQLFEPALRIRQLEPCYNSHAARSGTELFFMVTR
ncbi:MAG TPA: methyltransferase domain-containing protein [Sediminibacterium sp.]|nr:methyltransferase domain-containing protein [Sediminibacterium sp.]